MAQQLIFSQRRQRGFSLVEAMVAFIVLASSMLAFTRVQVGLRANSEVSKQRNFAVQWAQERIDEIRSFNFVNEAEKTAAGWADTAQYYANIATATETATPNNLNVTYTRSVTISEPPVGDNRVYKVALVNVSWTDRFGRAQQVVLNTLISGASPSLSAHVSTASNSGSGFKKPLSRNLKIPVEAVDLGGGKSGFIPPGANDKYFVFSNDDASIFQQCSFATPTTTLTKAEYDANGQTNCQTAPGYFVTGSISFDLTNKITLLESGGKRPADPATSVCSYYNALGNLVNGTASTFASINAESVMMAQNMPLYYALAVTAGTKTPAATCAATNVKPTIAVTTSLATSSNKLDSVKVVSSTVTPNTITGTWSVAVTNSTSGAATLTFTPGTTLPVNTAITLTLPINAVEFYKRQGGSSVLMEKNASAITHTFTTGGSAPTLNTSASTPSPVTNMSQSLKLAFSGSVKAGTGVIRLNRVKNANSGQSDVVESFTLPASQLLTFSGSEVTINPVADLISGETYFLTVDNGAIVSNDSCAVSYAGMSDSSGFSFTTSGGTTSGSCPSNPSNFIGLGFNNTLATTPSGGTVTCYTDSLTVAKNSTSKYVSFFCAVMRPTGNTTGDFSWGGSLKVSGPSGWLANNQYKVCRYTDPKNKGSGLTNDEHPDPYSNVKESLTDQNFLIIKAGETCPKQELNVANTLTIYFNTLAHQP